MTGASHPQLVAFGEAVDLPDGSPTGAATCSPTRRPRAACLVACRAEAARRHPRTDPRAGFAQAAVIGRAELAPRASGSPDRQNHPLPEQSVDARP